MTKTQTIAAVTFATLVMLTGNLQAQTNAQMVQGQIQTQVRPEALVVAPPTAPKLGFSGQFVPGVGMKVLHVNFGGPAHKAGLEHGDIIMSANTLQIRQQSDLSRALALAAQHNGGRVNLFVKNVRGTSCQGNQYVNVTAFLFGPPHHEVTPLPMPITQN